jgi:hypothetical protein
LIDSQLADDKKPESRTSAGPHLISPSQICATLPQPSGSARASVPPAYGDASISVDPELGVADSGEMEADRPELFVRVGEAAKAASKAWTLRQYAIGAHLTKCPIFGAMSQEQTRYP